MIQHSQDPVVQRKRPDLRNERGEEEVWSYCLLVMQPVLIPQPLPSRLQRTLWFTPFLPHRVEEVIYMKALFPMREQYANLCYFWRAGSTHMSFPVIFQSENHWFKSTRTSATCREPQVGKWSGLLSLGNKFRGSHKIKNLGIPAQVANPVFTSLLIPPR